tara:strand:- start:815 stop:1135 length:321 start_codon:yes stop_codon:yes gene_type:complete
MPCYGVIESTVGLETGDKRALHDALEALGYEVAIEGHMVVGTKRDATIVVDTTKKTLTTEGVFPERMQNELKRAYSKAVLTRASRKFGWTVKNQGEQQFAVVRRGR